MDAIIQVQKPLVNSFLLSFFFFLSFFFLSVNLFGVSFTCPLYISITPSIYLTALGGMVYPFQRYTEEVRFGLASVCW